MNRKNVYAVIGTAFGFLFLCGSAKADPTVAEFRHLIQDSQQNFTYFGCDTCTLSSFLPLPPSVTYGGASPPATATFTPLTNIAQAQFEFGGQAGLSVAVDETNLPTGSDFWSRSEMHVETQVDFVDVVQVQGVSSGQIGTVAFNWALTGDHYMTLDARNSIGPTTVDILESSTVAELSIDSAAMGLPPIMPFRSENVYPGSGTFPPPSITNQVVTQDVGGASGAVVFQGVPFSAGTDLAVSFDLLMSADLAIKSVDAPIFSGVLDSDFSNTATLTSVAIYDENNQLIENAFLQSVTSGAVYPSETVDPDPVLDVSIDVTPFRESNDINNNGFGIIPVAILGSEEFDVTQIDLGTVDLDTLPIWTWGSEENYIALQVDLNHDSFTDYLVAIDDAEVVYEQGNQIATLSGALVDGQLFEGADAIYALPNGHNLSAVPEPCSSTTTMWFIIGIVAAGIRRRLFS